MALADYTLSLQLVLDACSYLFQPDAVFCIFISVDSSGFEILVEMFHLSFKLHHPLPQLVEVRGGHLPPPPPPPCQPRLHPSIFTPHYPPRDPPNVFTIRHHDHGLPYSPIYLHTQARTHPSTSTL